LTPAGQPGKIQQLMDYRVAVIGAGPAGLAALKALSEAGFDVTCFEKGDRVGGIWAFENSSGLSAAYRTLHLNTSRARTEFASFPMPASYPDFPSHEQIAAWFDAYVDHFDLRERIRFEAGVERAERRDGWTVTLEDGTREAFDVVVAANGHNWEPRWPDPPHPGSFDGRQMHAHDFRDNAPFAGRRVLVVGMGNSAMDIAVESSWVAERTLLSVRSGSHVVPKYLLGRPADQITSPLAARRVPWRLRGAAAELRTARAGRGPAAGPPHDQRHDPVPTDPRRGRGTARGGGARGCARALRRRLDRGGRRDRVVHGLPRHAALPRPGPGGLDPRGAPALSAHLPPGRAGSFFVGLVQSTGSAIPIVERQSELVADHLAGRYALPPRAERMAHSESRRRAAARRYGEHKRPALRVEFDRYMQDLARELAQGRRRAKARGYEPPLTARPQAAPA
jgi:hypothetical protein